jgi:two-component system chemotaxis response regulator CheB
MRSSEIRVLLVDDSVAVRRALAEAIEREPGLTVCGAAPNGLLGLELVARTRPQVVVLDLEMPVLNGLEFLSRLRPQHPRLPVLVFSGVVGHANEATLEALWRGASDYVLKPQGLSAERTAQYLRDELFPRLRALAGAATARTNPVSLFARPAAFAPETARPPAGAPAPPRPMGPDPLPSVVVLGASTGGPRALAAVLAALPGDFPLPVALVQHMPAEMAEFFATGLANSTGMPVRLASDRERMTPGCIWVAPGGVHLVLEGDGPWARFRLDRGPEVNGCRPAVDPLFRSAANVFGPGALAVVLTGMGQDGLEGARAVRAAHGRVLVQDEGSSVVWGMPGAIARAGLANGVLPLDALGAEILSRASRDGGDQRRAA